MNIIPAWTDSGTEVIAPVTLARGAIPVRGTFNLASKFGAYLFLAVGRGGTNQLTNGVNVEVRRTFNAGNILLPPATHFATVTAVIAAVSRPLSGAYNVGAQQFTLGGTGTINPDDDLCFWGTDSIPQGGTALPNLEFARASLLSGNTLTIDAPCRKAKINNEIVTNRAESWAVWCPGGCIYEVIFDYMDDAAGDAVAIAAWVQIFDSLTKS